MEEVNERAMMTRMIHWKLNLESATKKSTAHSTGAKTRPPQKMLTSPPPDELLGLKAMTKLNVGSV